MLKYHTIDVSCRAIPEEVSLIFNITGCIVRCPGCCERALWKDKGLPLTFDEVRSILKNYNCAVSCVCFMGGEHEPQEINALARFVKHNYPCLRTAWYSGLDSISKEIDYRNFDYLKTGAYEASKGALGTPGTNQRVFQVSEDCSLTDITDKYIRTEPDEEPEASAPQEEAPAETETTDVEPEQNIAEDAVAEAEAVAYEDFEANSDNDISNDIEEDLEKGDDLENTTDVVANEPEDESPAPTSGIIMQI